MNQVPTRTSTTALERDVPVIRLKNDADLRVWRASVLDCRAAVGTSLSKLQIVAGDLHSTHNLHQKRSKLHFSAT